MSLELSALEARVIGCLIEKQVATPDQYPLSLNALVNACNQRSNRDPVLNVTERDVQEVVDGLQRKQLVLEKSGFGSRVPKYHQLFCNTQFGSLQFSSQQTAIVCELLLRGPQTPGELRTHAARLAPLRDVEQVEAALEELTNRPDGPYVAKLEREPGRREARYAQLFTGPLPQVVPGAAAGPESPRAAAAGSASLLGRVEALEAAVEELRSALARAQFPQG
ncbi:MAG: YceH family protein [Steroidobacteraceae bacterium]